jgi:hypothetical protein
MTQARVSRIAAVLPLLCSALAFAVVMANILSGVRPEPDENASAHLWQLLMIAQLPLILLFAATADWRRWTPVFVIGLQLVGMGLACLPVWLAGY